MALASALYSGISGLSTLGNAMQIIGDNIANVNTVGFKGSHLHVPGSAQPIHVHHVGDVPGRKRNRPGGHLQQF